MSVTPSEATAATVLSPATDAAAVGGAGQLFVGGAYEAEVVPWMQQAEEAATEMRAQRPAAGPPSRTVTQPKQAQPQADGVVWDFRDPRKGAPAAVGNGGDSGNGATRTDSGASTAKMQPPPPRAGKRTLEDDSSMQSAPNEAIPRKAKNGPDATPAGDDEWRRRVEAEEAAQKGEPPPLPPASEDDRAQRPPAQLTSAQVAAAVRLGMQSAGLSWLQRAAAADAATSAAGPRGAEDDPPSREPKGRADADVPLIGEPPKHAREVILGTLEGFAWPDFAFIAFYEHSGEEREANARQLGGAPTCSVADRRSILPPSANAWHFIGTVQDFVMVYPHPIRRQSNHVTCGHANWASWRTWPAKILDGSMRRSAEEFLWINSLGDRSTGEQPPSAHQHTVGPPTFTINGHHFGAPSKTYCKWARNVPAVQPTDEVPTAQRWTELSVTGTPEAKTVKRSYTPRNMADEEARVHAAVRGGDESEFGRPASQPCREYPEWRRQLAHSFGLFAAHYAPTVDVAWLHTQARAPAIIMVPVAQSAVGACAMVSLRSNALFGAERDVRRGGAEQGEAVAAFITGGTETQYAAPLHQYGNRDAVILVPWPQDAVTVLTSTEQRETALAAGLSAAWCTLGALHDHAAYVPIGLAFQRMAALTTEGEHGAQQPGTWLTAKPMVRTRTARRWAQRQDAATEATARARAAFMAAEAERGDELRHYLIAVDEGDGEMVALADSIKTAADYQDEIPFPPNGLPDFSSPALRLLPFTERPLRLDTSWLARLPPQQVPPGFKPLPWQGIVRGWARRRICTAMNATADRDFDCWEHGETSLPRPPFVCIGPGGGKLISHIDGIGHYNALSIVYELDTATGLYDKLDYQRPGRTHWVLSVIKRIFGDHDDAQLMSLIMHGVRWGVKAPLQIRIAPNLERLDSRIRGVGAAFKKLIDKGLYYKYRPLRRAHEAISPDGPGPFVIIPTYVVGTGGTDKPDNPDEKRIIGDQTSPHPEQDVRERNYPHGEPDGPPAVSMNNMMGPTPGTTPRGQPLDPERYPMPHPESKPGPKDSYNDSAIMCHMAHVGGTYVATIKDDGRHMFFQFEQSPEEERTCNFIVLILLPKLDEAGQPLFDADGVQIFELWFVLIVATCMNMGSRNASKIAQRFTDRLLEGFSRQLDVYVQKSWLPRQTPELQQLLAERAATLGAHQARPFATSGYTDDYKLDFLGPELLAAGSLIWRSMCREGNYWLSAKACAGTVVDYIGGRLVLNGGFGCLSPTKHARAVSNSMAYLEGALSRDELESHNSFLVHVHDWLDFPEGTLKGLSAPLKLPGMPEQMAVVQPAVAAQHTTIIELLRSRCAASFWSGVDEAKRVRSGGGGADFDGVIFAPRITSDSCSDVANPSICAVANGLFFRFPLVGEWRYRHITLTEACGTVLAVMIFGSYFPELELMVESDATASLAAARATAAADDLLMLRRRADKEERFREAKARTWVTHCKGWANGLSDAGSRDKMSEMRGLAAAFGMRLREIPVPPEALALMQYVLDNSTRVVNAVDAHDTAMGRQNLNMIGDMPVAHGDAMEIPWPRPAGWEDSDDDVEDEVSVDLRCARCFHRYYPVRSCRCRRPSIVEAGEQQARPDSPARESAAAPSPPGAGGAADGGGKHSTSMGTHNLNMMGNMPVAHMLMQELLDRLDAALRLVDEPPGEVSRLAALVATRAGAGQVRQGTIRAVVAACRLMAQPHAFPDAEAAAKASGCAASKAREWRRKISAVIQSEGAAAAAAAGTGGAGPSGASDGAAPSHCAPSEVDALSGLLDLARHTRPDQPGGPPPSAPPSPPGADGRFGADEAVAWFDALTAPAGSAEDQMAAAWDDMQAWAQRITLEDGRARGSTALGRHNLNMMGDMPIAHGGGRDDDASPAPLRKPARQRAAGARPQASTHSADSPPEAAAPRPPRPMDRGPALEGRPELTQRAAVASPAVAALKAARRSPRHVAAERQASRRRLATVASRPASGLAERTPLSPEVARLAVARSSPRRVKHECSTARIDDEIEAQPRARCTSPQPETAAKARARAALDIAKRLAEHDSPYALFSDRPEVLQGVVIDAAEARDAGIPHGTANADEWGFKWVRRFAEATGNPWMRPRTVATDTDVLCEVWFTIMALVWIAQMIKPSARRLHAGYEQGKPTSALLAIYGHRRVMRDCGRYLPDLAATRGVLKGICARYKIRWGDDAFVPQRMQPFSTAHLRLIAARLTPEVTFAAWPPVLQAAVRTAFTHAVSTGARKDEWTAHCEGDSYARRDNFAWVDDAGNDLPSTPDVISSRRNGCLLRGRSNPSKCDRLNIDWGGRDMWFRYDDTNALNFAWRWRQWEEAYPCPLLERRNWPAFSPSGDATPFTGARADACLNALLAAVMTAAEAALRSWHSARITLATRLFARRTGSATSVRCIARDEVEGVIQSLVRWKTPEAMRIYARMEAAQYADYVDMATDLGIASDGTMPGQLPEVDPRGVVLENEATIAAIEAEAAKAAKGKRAAAGDGGKQTGRRRAAPTTGQVSAEAAPPEATQRSFDIGDGQVVRHAGDDSWGVVGQQLRMHNSFWGWEDGDYTACRVVGYAGNYVFPDGRKSKHTYVIECEGHCYPAPHGTVARHLADAAVKRRINKAPPPRLL